MNSSNRAFIVCEGIHKSFGRIPVLTDVSFALPSSGAIGLIGPNGSGKSTLLNVISGFAKPDTGRCMIGDHNIVLLRPYEVARLGVSRTFQSTRIIQGLTVLDNVRLSCIESKSFAHAFVSLWHYTSDVKKISLEILDKVALSAVANVLARNLSYGQRKLLSLACCLATHPNVYIFDEPFSGIDTKNLIVLETLIRELSKTNLVICVDHNTSLLEILVNDMLFISNGRITNDI